MGGKKGSNSYYPVFLNIRGKNCVVIGGGEVALRKVQSLLDAGASVTVVSPTFCPELGSLADSGAINLVQRNYQTGDLKKVLLAIAATDNVGINRKVAEEAGREGTLVNVVDDIKLSGFIVPACYHRGDLTIAVSTAGKSPAMARKIRQWLEANLGEEYAALITLIDEVRSELKKQGVVVSSRDWDQALDLELLAKMVRAGRGEEVKTTLLKKLRGI